MPNGIWHGRTSQPNDACMAAEDVDTLRILLVVVIVGCVALLTMVFPVMDSEGEAPTPFRDLDREHKLGGHYQTKHPQCPKCRKGDV